MKVSYVVVQNEIRSATVVGRAILVHPLITRVVITGRDKNIN